MSTIGSLDKDFLGVGLADERPLNPLPAASADKTTQYVGTEGEPEIQYALQDDLGYLLVQNARRKDVEKLLVAKFDEADQILEDGRRERLDSLRRIGKSLGGSGMREFIRQARRLFPDDSDFVLALRNSNKSAIPVNEAEQRLLNESIAEVFSNGNSRHIKAGINGAESARRSEGRLRISAKVLRQVYRDYLDLADQLPDLYDDWLARFERMQRAGLSRYIAETLVADRRAADPSCSPDMFAWLSSRANVLRMMSASETAFLSSAPVLEQERGLLDRLVSGLMTAVMRDPKSTSAAVGVLCARVPTAEKREEWVQWAYRALAMLPVGLLQDGDARHAVLNDVLALSKSTF